MPNVHYVLCVTSCNRFDLLKASLDSFINAAGIKPRATFICEDSSEPMPDWLKDNYPTYCSYLGKITWISNGFRRGQVYAIDRLIAAIPKDIERVMWMEDDWNWQGQGVLQEALCILDKYPDICQVVFRKDWPHPLINDARGFKIAQPNWRGGWGGWTWNPHMTRVSDLRRFGTYASQAGYVNGLKHEIVFSQKFLDAGYRIAAIPNHCYHTGAGRSRSIEPLPESPKILIAIPVCHKFSYGQWEGDHTNDCVAKDYHFSGDNDRVQAVRDTWLKDTKLFPNVTVRFFYGQPTPAGFVPKDDEVILGCGDDYASLPAKTIEICKYAKEHDYVMLFKCDDDTGVYVDRVIQEAIFSQWDYAGFLNGRVCTGGTGYWLTKRAFSVIAEHATPTFHWAEDVTVSHFLFFHNIQGAHLEGHRTGRSDHWFWKNGFDPKVDMSDVSAFHAVRPSDMRAWYACR